MHIRNIFKDAPPDFLQLAEQYPEFRPYVEKGLSGSKGYVNFKDPASLRALSTVLLKKYFDIQIDIPLDRLIPTIPLRLNYIHWIEDLMEIQNGSDSWGEIRGIDLGCGASCVYALLSNKMNRWKFTCTEIDQDSFKYAVNNVKLNKAENDIKVLLSLPNSTILKHLFDEGNEEDSTNHHYHFCMCNPPFFSEIHHESEPKNRTDHRPPPPSVCTASDNESLTHGGEVEFVRQIITESLQIKQKVRWYTTMLGKKSSIKPLTKYLKECKVLTYTTTEFKQGRTHRWGLAWTFTEHSTIETLPQNIRKKKKTKPFYLSMSTKFFTEFSIPQVLPNMRWEEVTTILWDITNVVHKEFTKLELEVEKPHFVTIANKNAYEITGKAFHNTWIHQRQKRRKQIYQPNPVTTAKTNVMSIPENGTEIKTTATTSTEYTVTNQNDTKIPTLVTNDKKQMKRKYVNAIGNSTEEVDSKKIKWNDTSPDDICTPDMVCGSKAENEESDKNCLFTFSCIVGVSKQFGGSCLNDPMFSLLCLEGNRELFHQLVLYLKNVFYCIQINMKT